MSEVFSILLHNRQRYEQGKEGLWLSLPTTTEKLQEALREIGISADNPQDFFLYDYRSPQEHPVKLPRDLVLAADTPPCKIQGAALKISGRSSTTPTTWTTLCICRMCDPPASWGTTT